jgi:signal transduction histidine kinase
MASASPNGPARSVAGWPLAAPPSTSSGPHGHDHLRAQRLTLATALVCAVATAIVVTVPGVRFAYRLPELHIALETAATLAALLAAYLVYGRLRRSSRLDDLLLAAGLLVLGGTNLCFSALPAAIAGGEPTEAASWAAAAGRSVGSVLLVAAAYAGPRRVRGHGRKLAWAVLVPLALIAVSAAVFESRLPAAVEAHLSPDDTRHPQIDGHPTVLAVQALAATLYFLAAVGFTRRAARSGDDLMRWFGVACTLAAFSRVNYLLYPSLYSQWVYTGDAFRLLFHLIVLLAAAREISVYWSTAAEAAILEERRRIARDLHDGLAQELAYVRRNLAELDEEQPAAARASAGVARALAESRRAIAALTEPLDEPADRVLERVAYEAARRAGGSVRLDLERDVALEPERREMLVRIASEAIANALRHSGTNVVHVALSNGSGVRLRVSDAGRGFDPHSPTTGFGLVSMRERAAAAGGTLEISSQPGRGTNVELTL